MTDTAITPTQNEVEAPHGEKMIEVRVRFWTNAIAEGEDNIRPKHGWDTGYVQIAPNPAHGIVTPTMPRRHFHSLAELAGVVEEVLIDNGIKLHRGDRTGKFMEA